MQQIQDAEAVEEIEAGEGFVSVQEYRRVKALADSRFNFIRKTIEIDFLHRNNPVLFQKKFNELIKPKQLFKHRVIELSESSPVFEEMRLTRTEFELMLMQKQGFKAREICMICNHRSANSVYVLMNRIRKKLTSDD